MKCKVIYGFDPSLSKTFHGLLFLLSESTDEFERRLALVWFGFFLREDFGKVDLPPFQKMYLLSTILYIVYNVHPFIYKTHSIIMGQPIKQPTLVRWVQIVNI